MFGRKLIGILVLVVAGLLAVGSFSALAGPAAVEDGSDQVENFFGLDGNGEAVCDTDGDGWGPDVVEFAGAVISVSEFGLVLRTDGDYVFVVYTPDTVFEDSSGELTSNDQVVQGVDTFVLAVSTDNSTWLEAILVRLLGEVEGDIGGDEVGGETDGDANCGDDGGDSDGDGDGDTDGDTDGDVGLLSHGVGPTPDRGCATGSLDHAREVLEALLVEDHPGVNEGIQNALDKMCHGDVVSTTSSPEFGDGDGGESEDHPGDGNAFGRGHGQGKPEGVPTNGGGDE